MHLWTHCYYQSWCNYYAINMYVFGLWEELFSCVFVCNCGGIHDQFIWKTWWNWGPKSKEWRRGQLWLELSYCLRESLYDLTSLIHRSMNYRNLSESFIYITSHSSFACAVWLKFCMNAAPLLQSWSCGWWDMDSSHLFDFHTVRTVTFAVLCSK